MTSLLEDLNLWWFPKRKVSGYNHWYGALKTVSISACFDLIMSKRCWSLSDHVWSGASTQLAKRYSGNFWACECIRRYNFLCIYEIISLRSCGAIMTSSADIDKMVMLSGVAPGCVISMVVSCASTRQQTWLSLYILALANLYNLNFGRLSQWSINHNLPRPDLIVPIVVGSSNVYSMECMITQDPRPLRIATCQGIMALTFHASTGARWWQSVHSLSLHLPHACPHALANLKVNIVCYSSSSPHQEGWE